MSNSAVSALVFALALVAASPLAAADDSGPLAPGKPAGVKEAQNNHQLEYILVGVSAAVAIGLGVILVKKYTKTPSTAATGTSS